MTYFNYSVCETQTLFTFGESFNKGFTINGSVCKINGKLVDETEYLVSCERCMDKKVCDAQSLYCESEINPLFITGVVRK